MDKEVLDHFYSEFSILQEAVAQFKSGNLSSKEYAHIAAHYGTSPQPGHDNQHILRLGLPGGRLNKEKIRFLLNTIGDYHIENLKITFSQSIQFHDLSLDTVLKILPKAWEAGFISVGNGSDYTKNVICSPLTGLKPGEYINVIPYVEAASNYLLKYQSVAALPINFKISFSSSKDNEGHASFNDLGFAARQNRHFDVYAGGGLGENPRLGILVGNNINPQHILYYIRTMMDVLAEYSYTKARYIPTYLGDNEFLEIFEKKLKSVMEQKDLDLTLTARSIPKKGNGETQENFRLKKQKQKGLYYVKYMPVGGFFEPEMLKKIYMNIVTMKLVELRLSTDGGVYIANLTAKEAETIYEITKGGAENLFEASIICAGNQHCRDGLINTQNLLDDCMQRIKKMGIDENLLPKLHISGCAASCSAQQIASLGFQGTHSKFTATPCVSIYYNGSKQLGTERLAKVAHSIPVDKVPDFLADLADVLHRENLCYDEWIEGHMNQFITLLDKYCPY